MNLKKEGKPMVGIITAITGIIPTVVSGLFDFFKTRSNRRAELNELEHERKMAVEQRLKELALDKSKADSLWALEQLKYTNRYMRWVTFIVIWAPIILGAFYPVEVQQYFTNVLSSVPDWWIGCAVGITTAIFGIREILRFKGK